MPSKQVVSDEVLARALGHAAGQQPATLARVDEDPLTAGLPARSSMLFATAPSATSPPPRRTGPPPHVNGRLACVAIRRRFGTHQRGVVGLQRGDIVARLGP